jgi:GT2 family glycosyltransferase
MSDGSVHERSVSVIIPAWNGIRYLPTCLDALLAQSFPDPEIIVVDNASVDGSADLVVSRYPRVRVLRNRENAGFAGACNAGMQIARGQILVLLNQDTSVRAGWLDSLVEAMQAPEVGVAGCKILYPDQRTIQHAGGWVEWPLALVHHYGKGENDVGQWDEARSVDYVTGAAMAIRRGVVDRLGGLDEGFAAREAGYTVVYSPKAVLCHVESTSISDWRAVSRALQRNRLRFVLKHLAPERFLAEFAPAEHAYQQVSSEGTDCGALSSAYVEAMSAAGAVLARRWQAGEETVSQVLSSLQQLYLASTSGSAQSSLREYRFRSSLPGVGPLVAGLRRLWYDMAARWAVRDLIQQQDALNQRQQALNEQLVRSVASLSGELARLQLRAEARLVGKESGDAGELGNEW